MAGIPLVVGDALILEWMQGGQFWLSDLTMCVHTNMFLLYMNAMFCHFETGSYCFV